MLGTLSKVFNFHKKIAFTNFILFVLFKLFVYLVLEINQPEKNSLCNLYKYFVPIRCWVEYRVFHICNEICKYERIPDHVLKV